MASDLEKAFNALSGKQAAYSLLWDYYDGDHPLVYSTSRLRDVFKGINARFTQNWCAVVIDAMLDRINLLRFVVEGNKEATDLMSRLWTDTGLALEEYDVHVASLVTGESFVIVWKDDENPVQAYYNDPRQCHVFYDPENPRRPVLAAKWWIGEDERRYITLYYPDRLEYYVSRGKHDQVQNASGFEPLGEGQAVNPFGAIPVFHFRRERRAVKSELTNAVFLQDAVNKLLADMMIAAEFGAFKQRYVISAAEIDTVLKNSPNEIWELPGGDGTAQGTQVGEFGATDLRNYLDAIDKLATSIAIITRTPKHYFFAQGGDPSGEALIAMEAPLNKKTSLATERLGDSWKQVAAFVLKLANVEVPVGAITPVFDAIETVQPLTQAQIRNTNRAAGLPLRTILKREGWSDEQLAEMEDDMNKEAQAKQANLATALRNAQTAFDQPDEAGG